MLGLFLQEDGDYAVFIAECFILSGLLAHGTKLSVRAVPTAPVFTPSAV